MLLLPSAKGERENGTLESNISLCVPALPACPTVCLKSSISQFPHRPFRQTENQIISCFISTVRPTGRGRGRSAGGAGAAGAASWRGSCRCRPTYPPLLQAGLLWPVQPCTSGFCDCSSEEKKREEHRLLGRRGATGHQEPGLAHTASKLSEVWGEAQVFFPRRSLRIWRAVELFSHVWTLYCTAIYVHGVAII